MMAVLAGWSTSSGISQYETESEVNCTVSLVNPVTIPFEVSVTTALMSELTLNIYDISGRHASDVASGSFPPGEHTFYVDGLNSGIYFIRVNDGFSFSSYRTVVVN